MNTQRQNGFTLIELVIVLAVLGTLAAIAVPQLTGLQDRADLAGTATIVSSELNNSFAQALAENDTATPWQTADVCASVTATESPALTDYTLAQPDPAVDGVEVTVPAFNSSTNTVDSVVCELSE